MQTSAGKQTRERYITSVWKFYAVGCDSLQRHSDDSSPGETIEEEAKNQKVPSEHLRKARQFAKTYSRKDVQHLESLCRRYRFPIGITYIYLLITVDADKREKLQATAIAEKWSVRRLKKEITWKFGRRKQGGRKRLRMEDATGVYGEIDRVCESWRRLVTQLKEKADADIAPLDRVDTEVRQQIRKVWDSMRKLRRLVEDIRQREAARSNRAGTNQRRRSR